eukprot:TRINITY_DN6596_c0_g1_i1.p1 TRINITY_DN6596_c0_g1~~TRINITY_DN6596_c0_g1_i1.p1  ORF type:complete len:897 (+),score=246.55 TRINITY_DN6596_c0_g1_i1:73-2763(+)
MGAGQSQAFVQAAANNDETAVSRYIESGGDVNGADPSGNTALCEASSNGHSIICRLLLRHGANVDLVGSEGMTPLMKAAKKGHTNLCRLLLEHGANTSKRDHYGWTAHHIAKQAGHVNIATLLSKWSHKATATPVLAVTADETIVRRYIAEGGDPNVINADGSTLLTNCARAGDEGACRILIDAGANVNAPDRSGMRPLSHAASAGHTAASRLLLRRGATVDAVDDNGWTALMYAANNGSAALCRHLLENGANPLKRNKDNCTAKDEAAQWGYAPVIAVLERADAGGVARPVKHRTLAERIEKQQQHKHRQQQREHLFLCAATSGDEQTVRRFLVTCGDVNAVDDSGNTALMRAAAVGQTAIACLLLDHGADVSRVNVAGETALQIAARSHQRQVVNILTTAVFRYRGGVLAQLLQAERDAEAAIAAAEEAAAAHALRDNSDDEALAMEARQMKPEQSASYSLWVRLRDQAQQLPELLAFEADQPGGMIAANAEMFQREEIHAHDGYLQQELQSLKQALSDAQHRAATLTDAEQLKELRKQQESLQAKQALLLDEIKLSNERATQMLSIVKHTSLRCFYSLVHCKLNEFFIGAMAVQATDTRRTAEHVLAGFHLGEEFLDVPLPPALMRCLSTARQFVNSYRVKSGTALSENAVAIGELACVTESIARSLTLCYEQQLLRVTTAGACVLAESCVRKVITALLDGIVQDTLNLVPQLLSAVLCTEPHGNAALPQPQPRVVATLKESDVWTDMDVLHRCGIVTEDGLYYRGGAGGAGDGGAMFGSDPARYGYRLGTASEAQSLQLIAAPRIRWYDDIIDTDTPDESDLSDVLTSDFVLASSAVQPPAGSVPVQALSPRDEEKRMQMLQGYLAMLQGNHDKQAEELERLKKMIDSKQDV